MEIIFNINEFEISIQSTLTKFIYGFAYHGVEGLGRLRTGPASRNVHCEYQLQGCTGKKKGFVKSEN